MNRICPYCGEPLPEDIHLNKVYCYDSNCYDKAKSIREKEKRKAAAIMRKLKKKTAFVLELLWSRFGQGNPFDPIPAEEMEFDFSVTERFISIDGHRAGVVLGYAYIVINPQKMIVWKLLNQE